MSRSDINNTFAGLSGLLLLGGVASWLATGNSSIVTIMMMIYFMLVATNSIKRGEASRYKK